MGALDDKRLEFFLERYQSLQNDPDIPPFHYGTHYSSAGMTPAIRPTWLMHALGLVPELYKTGRFQGYIMVCVQQAR